MLKKEICKGGAPHDLVPVLSERVNLTFIENCKRDSMKRLTLASLEEMNIFFWECLGNLLGVPSNVRKL